MNTTYLFIDKEVVELVTSDLAITVHIDDVELALQLPLHVVLHALLLDALVDRVRVRQALTNVHVRVHDGSPVGGRCPRRNQSVDICHLAILVGCLVVGHFTTILDSI